MVDLNTLIPANSSLRLAQALNINDRGEILGLGVPPGAPTQDETLNFFSHVFLLIPCEHDDNPSCENADESANARAQLPQSNQGLAKENDGGLTREALAAFALPAYPSSRLRNLATEFESSAVIGAMSLALDVEPT